MRLWSLHPSYLDAVGLVALWREGLLARKVLQGQTKGYIHHPQLFRFRETGNPIHVLDFYLKGVHDESIRRGYHFDLSKISPCENRPPSLLLPEKQLEYEFFHLLDKLKERSPRQYSLLQQIAVILPHPLFQNKTRRYLLLGEKACFVINMTSFPFPETIDLFNSDGDQTTDIRHSHLITRQLLQRTELL